MTLAEAARSRSCAVRVITARCPVPWRWAARRTRAQRHLAVAADTELRRRHPDQHYPPLRSAEPEPHLEPDSAVDSQHVELAARLAEMSQQIKDLTAAHRTFAERLAARQTLMVPSQDPEYGDLAQAFPLWSGGGRNAILQPPKPNIRPSAYVLERAAGRDADREAAD
jgi:hypothetical protein